MLLFIFMILYLIYLRPNFVDAFHAALSVAHVREHAQSFDHLFNLFIYFFQVTFFFCFIEVSSVSLSHILIRTHVFLVQVHKIKQLQ